MKLPISPRIQVPLVYITFSLDTNNLTVISVNYDTSAVALQYKYITSSYLINSHRRNLMKYLNKNKLMRFL